MTEPDLTPDPGYAGPAGPFETEDDARTHPAVRAVYEASHASSRRGVMDEQNRRLLEEACAAAGVSLGAYDRRILGWLANYEPQTCMVIAGLITRAHQADQVCTAAIDMHRWYAIVKHADTVLGVIGVQGSDGLGLYDSREEWEHANG